MSAQTIVKRAMQENPEIPLILEVVRRARELEERAVQEPLVPAHAGANPVASQGIAFSGHVLKDK
jgi:hypothetical protein